MATLSFLLLSKYYISILGSSGVGENADFAHTGEESFWRIWAYLDCAVVENAFVKPEYNDDYEDIPNQLKRFVSPEF